MKTLGKMVRTIWINNFVGVIWSYFAILMLGFLYNSIAGRIIITILTGFFSVLFVYESCWNQGFKDRNYAHYGRMEEDKWRGLKAGMFAAIPHLIIAILYFISKAASVGFAEINVLTRIWFSPWIALVDMWMVKIPFILLAFILPICAAAAIGYQLGYRDFSLMERLIYKNAGKKGAALAEKKRNKRASRVN